MYPNSYMRQELEMSQQRQMSKKASKNIDKDSRFAFVTAVVLFTIIGVLAVAIT